jgi:lipid-A-disaccharide synthase
LREDKAAAFAAADVALAASGTVVLELALAQVPQVAAYLLNRTSAFLAKRIVHVEYVTLINLLLNRAAIPELLQERCRGDLMEAEIVRLIEDQAARAAQLAAGYEALAMLRPGPGSAQSSERAAATVLEIVEKGKRT